MKYFGFAVIFFSSLFSFAEQMELPLEPRQCISISQAQQALKNYLTPMIGHAPFDDFPWLDGTTALTKKDVQKALNSMKWNSRRFVYETTSIVYGECAPAASCWGWYTVDCQGKIDASEGGED